MQTQPQSLTARQCHALIRDLFDGHPGFPYKTTPLATLRAYIAAWGTAPDVAARIDALMVEIDTLPAAPVLTLPAVPAAPAPAAPVPIAPAPVPAAPPLPVVQWPTESAGEALADAFADVAVPTPVPAAPAPVAAVPAPAPAVPGMYPRRVLARELFADVPAETLEAIPADLYIRVYGDAAAPAVDSGYVFDGAILRRALVALSCECPLPTWLTGGKGTGKSDFAKQIAARCGRAYFRVSFTRLSEPADFIGDMGLRDGATVWQDGPVTAALRTPGAICLLDELSYCPAGLLAFLNPILEGRGAPVRLPRCGELLNVAADVCVYAADNTNGTGDSTGEYAARNVVSADTRDRFRFVLTFNYLPADVEARLLRANVARECGRKLTTAAARAIVNVCNVARTKADAGELQGAPGLRAASAMAILMAHGESAPAAFDVCAVRAAPAESHETLRAIFAANWPANDPDVAKFIETQTQGTV